MQDRQSLGLFFRDLLASIDRLGLRAQVLLQVSPDTALLMQSPPPIFSWLDARHIDEVQKAVGKIAGEEALVELGLSAGRGLGMSVAQPLLRAAFHLFGKSPVAILFDLDRFFSLVTRGISFAYFAGDEEAGAVEASFVGKDVSEAAFHVLRGSLQFVFEVAGAKGLVGRPEILEQGPLGSRVRFQLAWGKRAEPQRPTAAPTELPPGPADSSTRSHRHLHASAFQRET